MTLEQPQQFGLSQEQKEAALKKHKLQAMKLDLQSELMKERGFGLTGNNETDLSHMKDWVNSHENDVFRKALEEATTIHPNILEIYENDRDEALAIVREQFELLHEHA